MICDVVLYASSVYGPLPAPREAEEFSHFSALSSLAAPGAAVPPCSCTSSEFTIPSDVFVEDHGSAGSGSSTSESTVYLPATTP